MNWKLVPLFFAFLCMGFGDAVNTFVGPAKDLFTLSELESGFITFAGFIMFGLLSVPMGIFQDRFGRKKTLLIGLTAAFLGILTVMILGYREYAVFLLAILLLGAGATILQVSGNPLMRDVSSEGRYSSNLSLGQFFKSIGSFTAPIVFFVSQKIELPEERAWEILFPIFAIAIAISIVSLVTLKVEEKKSEEKAASIGSCLGLLKEPYVFFMVLGIFLYVGAEVSVASGMQVYFKELYQETSSAATKYVMYFFVAIIVGRLLGAAVLRKISPRLFLILSAWVSLAGFALLIMGSGWVAPVLGAESFSYGINLAALFVITLGFSNMFPLIFSMAVDRMPSKSNELSGLMISAICGGAFLPLAKNAISEFSGNALLGYSVPMVVVVYILCLGLKQKKGAPQS